MSHKTELQEDALILCIILIFFIVDFFLSVSFIGFPLRPKTPKKLARVPPPRGCRSNNSNNSDPIPFPQSYHKIIQIQDPESEIENPKTNSKIQKMDLYACTLQSLQAFLWRFLPHRSLVLLRAGESHPGPMTADAQL